MHWIYQGQPIEQLPEHCEAFVYVIHNNTNGRKYVGKKIAKSRRSKPPLKGRTRRRRTVTDSDWREYWGSNEHLKQDVEELGAENFTREILFLCDTRGMASYLEAKLQFDHEVLLSDEYYNGIINVRVGSSQSLKENLQKLHNLKLIQ